MRKVYGADEERKSRFHSRRGEIMPLGAMARIPILLARRLVGSQTEPWMASGAIRWLDENLSKDMSLLELGAGSSTGWYAARVKRVVSIEPDPTWLAAVTASLRDLGNVELIGAPIREALPRLLRESFDVVIVDHSEINGDLTRPEALAQISSQTAIIVLDDSDRPSYQHSITAMSEWTQSRYRSYRSKPIAPTETTIFVPSLE
jgi:predicted O-methyltransferase YrrM